MRPRRPAGASARPLSFTVSRRRVYAVLYGTLIALFTAAVFIAVVGNLFVYISLRRRDVPVRFARVGVPFYLYGECVRAHPPVGPSLRRLALATNIAFIGAFVLGIALFATEVTPTSNNRWRGP